MDEEMDEWMDGWMDESHDQRVQKTCMDHMKIWMLFLLTWWGGG